MAYDNTITKVAILTGIVFFFAYSLFPNVIGDTKPMTMGTDLNEHYAIISELRSTGNLFIENSIYNDLPENIRNATVPRDAVNIGDNIVLKGFLGNVFLYSVMISAFGELYPYITILLTVLTGFAFFLLVRELFNENIALVSMILYFSFPFTIFMTMMNVIDITIPFLLFFFMGFYYFIKIMKTNKTIYYAISGLFFSTALTLRYENVILIAPLAFILLISKRKDINVKGVLIAFAILLSVVIPILMINNALYGGYFKTGYPIGFEKFVSYGATSFLNEQSMSHISLYLFGLYAPYTILLIIGIILFFKGYDPKKNQFDSDFKLIFVYIILAFLAKVIISSSYNLYGHEYAVLNASFVRYISPAFLLLFPFISYLILKIKDMRVIAVLLVVIMLLNFNTTVYGSGDHMSGVSKQHNALKYWLDELNFVINNTDERSLIVVNDQDKMFFPDRNILLYGPLENMSSEDFVDSLISAKKANISVYFFNPASYIKHEKNFTNTLLAKNYRLMYIGGGFYKMIIYNGQVSYYKSINMTLSNEQTAKLLKTARIFNDN